MATRKAQVPGMGEIKGWILTREGDEGLDTAVNAVQSGGGGIVRPLVVYYTKKAAMDALGDLCAVPGSYVPRQVKVTMIA